MVSRVCARKIPRFLLCALSIARTVFGVRDEVHQRFCFKKKKKKKQCFSISKIAALLVADRQLHSPHHFLQFCSADYSWLRASVRITCLSVFQLYFSSSPVVWPICLFFKYAIVWSFIFLFVCDSCACFSLVLSRPCPHSPSLATVFSLFYARAAPIVSEQDWRCGGSVGAVGQCCVPHLCRLAHV